jgi:MFS family permease
MRPSQWSPRAFGWGAALVAAAGVSVLVWWPFAGSSDLELRAWEMVPNLLLMIMFAIAWLVVPIGVVARRFVAAVRLGGRRRRARTALLAGVGRPVWQLVLAVLLLTAAGTFLTLRLYLTAAARGWGDSLLWASLASLAVVGVTLLVLGVAGVAAVSRRSFHSGVIAGTLTLAALTAGYLAVYLPERYAYRADPGSYPSGWNLGQGDLLIPFDLFFASLLFALPWPVLGAALGARSADLAPRGRDGWDRLLQVATAGLRGGNRAWGAAMRAELANIDERGERRRFALGCTASALRLGVDRTMWPVAAGAAGLAAVWTYIASRASLGDGAGGILLAHGSGVAVVVFAATLVIALRQRSFRAGVQGGILALLAAFVASYTVGVSEAIVWAERRAGYLTTGDAVPPSAEAAVLDLLRPEFVVGNVAYGLLSMLLAAAMGALVARRRAQDLQPAQEVSPSPILVGKST